MLTKHKKVKLLTGLFLIVFLLFSNFNHSLAASHYERDADTGIRLFADTKVCFVTGETATTKLSLVNTRTGSELYATDWTSSDTGKLTVTSSIGKGIVTQNSLAKPNEEAYIYCNNNGNTYRFQFSIVENHQRANAVNYMYRMGTIPWKTGWNTIHYKRSETSSSPYYWKPFTTYYGIPYTNRTVRPITDLNTFRHQGLSDDGQLALRNEAYMGNDCSSALCFAWNYGLYRNPSENFFKENQYYGYPKTKAFMMYKSALEPGYAIKFLLPKIALTTLENSIGLSLRLNLSYQGYDTKIATTSQEEIMTGSHTGKTVSEVIYASYQKLKPADAVIHYKMNDSGGYGHTMLVRASTENGIYFIDQHSLFVNSQTNSDSSIKPGESTFSTYRFFTYERLLEDGYLPLRLNGIDKIGN
ncbi:MAG: hypothetical protein RSE55_09170 [Lachnospiraceae bacterium]